MMASGSTLDGERAVSVDNERLEREASTYMFCERHDAGMLFERRV